MSTTLKLKFSKTVVDIPHYISFRYTGQYMCISHKKESNWFLQIPLLSKQKYLLPQYLQTIHYRNGLQSTDYYV